MCSRSCWQAALILLTATEPNPAQTRLRQPCEEERKRVYTRFSHASTERTKVAIVESCGFCRWARPQHAFLSCPCGAVERRRYRAGALRRAAQHDEERLDPRAKRAFCAAGAGHSQDLRYCLDGAELRSYGAAFRHLGLSCHHEQGLRANNRAENSHQVVRGASARCNASNQRRR